MNKKIFLLGLIVKLIYNKNFKNLNVIYFKK